MPMPGWKQLLAGWPWFQGEGSYPIAAYSEFMPPPRLGWKPYGNEPPDPQLFIDEDPWGWYVTEYEEANELQPGLDFRPISVRELADRVHDAGRRHRREEHAHRGRVLQPDRLPVLQWGIGAVVT